MIQFVLRSWRSESCTEYWLWCVALCVGADRTVDVSTRRLGSECFLPWHVWIDSRTSVKCVKDARCIEGSCEHLVRLQTWYTRLSLHTLVRVQSFVIQPWTVLCLCVWTHDHIQKRHQNRTWNTVELDMIQFVWRSWRSESCTEYWLWCGTLCVGADRTADVSTRHLDRECSLPWHVWIDSRTSVKCVKDDRCIEGSCTHLVRPHTWYTGFSC